MKTIFTAIALTLAVAGSALAAEPTVVPTATTLEVKEMVSMTPADSALVDVCGVVPQTITYVGADGELKQTTFSRLGGGCGNG